MTVQIDADMFEKGTLELEFDGNFNVYDSSYYMAYDRKMLTNEYIEMYVVTDHIYQCFSGESISMVYCAVKHCKNNKPHQSKARKEDHVDIVRFHRPNHTR